MTEILIIRENISKIKNFLEREHINYEISQEVNKTEKLSEYIKTKSQEDIFSDYGEALKDKEREQETKKWDEMEATD